MGRLLVHLHNLLLLLRKCLSVPPRTRQFLHFSQVDKKSITPVRQTEQDIYFLFILPVLDILSFWGFSEFPLGVLVDAFLKGCLCPCSGCCCCCCCCYTFWMYQLCPCRALWLANILICQLITSYVNLILLKYCLRAAKCSKTPSQTKNNNSYFWYMCLLS